MTINERFGEVLNSKNISIKDAALMIGKSEGYVRKLLIPNQSFGIEPIKAILNSIKDVNPEWLITGDGNMFKNNLEESNIPFLETTSGVKYYELPNGKYRMRVPLIPISAYAKYIDEYRDAEVIDNLGEAEFIVDKIGHGKYFAFEIKGDSMDDGSIKSIPHGSTVLARELKREHWIEGNGLKTKDYPYWIIILDNTILCKQIIKQDKVEGKLLCHSLSPSREYTADFEIRLDEIRQLLNIVQKTLPAT